MYSRKEKNESFPSNQFVYQYNQSIISPYILDITGNKGGLMVFLKSHIPSRRHNDFKIPSNIQIIPLEINRRKEKNG